MKRHLAKFLSLLLTLSLLIGYMPVTQPVLAGAAFNQNAGNIFAKASQSAQDANPWLYKKYTYGRGEYPHRVPMPQLTVEYFGDNQVKVKARFNPAGEAWKRTFPGITVPKGFETPAAITVREFTGERLEKEEVFVTPDFADNYYRFSVFDGNINHEWQTRVLTGSGYQNYSNNRAEEREFNERFKNETREMFFLHNRPSAQIYELEYTTTVRDFKAYNNVLAFFHQEFSNYSRHTGIYAAEAKPVPPAPPAPPMADTYAFNRPAAHPVANPDAITTNELNQVIQNIKNANQGIDNVANVRHNDVTREFEVQFNDGSSIKIPEKQLVYRRPAPVVDTNNLPFKLGKKVMLPNREAFESLKQNNTYRTQANAKEIIQGFFEANGVDISNGVDNVSETGGWDGSGNKVTNYNQTAKTQALTGNNTLYYVKGSDGKHYYLTASYNSMNANGMRLFVSDTYPSGFDVDVEETTPIPFDKLFTYQGNPADQDPNKPSQDEKENAKNTIRQILDPGKFSGVTGVAGTRDDLLGRVDGVNTREDLNRLIEEANNHANAYRPQADNNRLNQDKERAKQIVNGLTHLTDENKKQILASIDGLSVNDQKNYATAKSELDNLVNNALTQDLDAAKNAAKQTVTGLANPITDGTNKDVFKPDEVNSAIDGISSAGLNPTTYAEKLAELEKLKNKAQVDSAREEMIDKLNQSGLNNKDTLINEIVNNTPDGTGGDADSKANEKVAEAEAALEQAKANAEKDNAKAEIDQLLPNNPGKATELKNQIDSAKTTEEIKAIIEAAKTEKEKDVARQKIDGLQHLNQAQKNDYKQQVDEALSRDELSRVLDLAGNLDNSMASLIAEVNKSKGIKDGNQAPYNGASANTRQAFETALNEATLITTLTNADNSANLDNGAVNALLNKLQKARLALAPDGTAKDDATLARERANEIKVALREKNKQVKEEIKTLKDDYSGFAALGNKDNPDEVGTIITDAERKIDAELAKLNNGTSADAVNAAISRIQAETETALAKEKVKAAIEKLTANINQQTDTNDKTPESIKAFNDAKQAGESVKTEAQATVDSPRTNAQELARAYDKVVAADQAVTEKRNSLQDNADIAGLNAKITALDALTKKARPSTYVADNTKQTATEAISVANTALGTEGTQDTSTARGLAAKQKPTKEEVDQMIATLDEKINALNTALTAERTEAKTKVNEIVTALFPENSANNEDQNKATYLAEVEKLTTDTTGVAATNPDQFINTLLTNATNAAVEGYAHLNDAQKKPAKANLLAKAKAVTANGNVNEITTAVSTLNTLNVKMDEVAKLKQKGDTVKAQVKYIKESTPAHKTAFNTAVDNLSVTTNKNATELDALMNAYTTALGNLDGKASAPDQANRVTVANPKALTQPEKTQILDAIIAKNTDITGKIDRANSSVSDTGEVTLVYNDAAQTTAGEAVEKTANSTLSANEVLVPAFSNPAKTLVSLENGNLSAADKDKVKDAVLKANKTLSESQPPQLTKDNITVENNGTVRVTLPGGETKQIPATDAVDKATKPNAVSSVGNKKTAVENAIDGMGLDPAVANALKQELTNAQNTANDAIANAQTDFDHADKDVAYTTAKTAVNNAVTTATTAMDKVNAKAELEKRAKEQKAAVDQLRSLSEANRKDLKDAIDRALATAKQNVDQAQDSNAVTTEKDNGLLAIDKVKAKGDIHNKGEEIKAQINAMTGLTEDEKRQAGQNIDNLVRTEGGKVDTATSATLTNVVNAATETLNREKLQAEGQNLESLNVQIATLDSLLEQVAPTKFVTDAHKKAVQTAQNEARISLGDQNNPTSAKGIAAKQNPTQDEINAMITTLKGKITALTTALDDSKADAKNKLDQIVGALFPDKDGTPNPNKPTFLAKVAKLTGVQDGDTDKEKITKTPDAYINEVLTAAIAAAVDGYTHLNDVQKDAHKASLSTTANAVTADGNVNAVSTDVTTLQNTDSKMEQVGKLKAQSEKVKAQVKYLKESNNTEKTAFDDAVTALTFDDNKTATQLDTLISNYNTALGALDGKASAPTAENRVSVANPNAITDDEKNQILGAIIAANPTIASKIDRNASSVTAEGVVTLVYNDGATVGADNVPATASTTFTAAEVLKASFNPPAKVLVSLGSDGHLTPADKENVKDAVLKANKTLSESTPPQLSRENITVNDDGSISVTLPNRNQTETVSAENAVDKTTKPTALTTVGNKKTEVENAIDGMNLTPEVAEKLKAELSKSKLKAENAITNAQTDLEDVDHKDTAYTTAKTAVNTAVSAAELEMEKIKAKAELEKAAKEHKEAIDALRPLDEAKRNDWIAQIDQALETAKQAVDAANNTQGVNTAKENGITEMKKEKAKADLDNQGASVKASIAAMTGLTDTQKNEATAEVNKVVTAETAKIEAAQIDQLDDAITAATTAVNAELEKAEGQNLEALNAKIEALDALTEQVRPTKYVTDEHKNTTDRLVADANTTLGEENSPAPASARGIAAKQPKPTAEEVNAMVTTLNGKIEALTNALNAERADAKNKLDAIVTALFPDKDGTPNPNKKTYLDKVAKLTGVQDGDTDKDKVTNTPDTFVTELITTATAAAVDGYTHLNNAQKAAHKTSLENAANAITADGNVDTITTAITGLKALDDKMEEVAKLKAKGDKVIEQVKYIKEGTEAEKTAFADAVTALTNVSTAATGENKDVAGLNALITNYNNALGNLNGEAVKPDPNNRVIVINPNQLTTEEKNKILDKIIAANTDIAAKIDRDNSQVSDQGVVTLVYKDGATTTANETVEKTGDTTFQPNDVLIPQFTKPAKTLVSLENGNLSAADKDKVKDAVLAANPELVAMQPPLLTKNNIEVADDGTITVTFDNNYTETVAADKAVDKRTKPTAMNTLTTKKDAVNASLNALGLSETAANRIQGELNTLFTTASEAIANVHTDLTAQDKEAAYNAAAAKVAPLLENAKLDMDKLLAKAELEKRAETQKAAVDALQPLDETKRNEWKAAIDQALNEAKAAIDQAQDNAAITTAKDAGQLAIDKLKGKAEIQNKGEEVKQAIDAMPSLTPAQKAEAKATVGNLVQSETAKVEGATADTLNGVVDAAKLALDKEKAKADLKDRAEEAKAHIDGLTHLTQEQKDAAKAEVGNTLTEELGNVENATADTLAEVLENGKNELDQDRAKADLKDRAEEAKAHIDGLTHLTQEQKDAAKAEVENTLTEELGNVENATADTLANVLENGMTELDQDRAKADVKDKAEEIKKHIATLTHLTEAQREAANNAVNKIVEVATTALENAAADDIEELIKNAKFDLDQEKAKADLLNEGENIKTHIDSLSDLTDDQKTAEKAKVDATVAEENAKIEALEPTGTPEENATALENAVNSANAELDQDKAKADLLNKGENIKKHIDGLSDLTDDQKTAEKAKVDATVTEESNKIENLSTNGTPEENATALENAVNSANAELDQDKAKADLLNKGENIKKHIDGLSDLTDEQKTAEKAKVDATVTEESNKIENLPTNGTPEENATALENAVNSANAELDQDKAKADLLNKGENIKKHIDGLSDLTDDQKTAEKAKVDATVTEESDKIENLSTNGTPEENATALENAVNSANAELDQDKAKADLLNKGEELKDYIDHMKHLSKEQKEKAKEAIDQDVAAGTEAIENLPTNGTPEANATALENTANIANAELDKEKAKAELLNEAEKIKDYVNILPTLNDDQKKDFKDQVDKVVAAETAALDAIVPTGDADADREAIQSEKDRADGLLKEIKDNVIETAKPILLGGEEEEYNPWVKLVFDQEKETEKDRVPNTGAHR